MKKKLLFIILCFFVLVPSVYGKYCTDYSTKDCSKHKTDDKKNTCAVIDGKCDFKTIKTPCSSVEPKKKYLIFGEKSCGLDSTGQLCDYDETTEKCINAATNQNHKICSDYSKDACPDYADGNACGKTKTGCKLKSETKCEDYEPGEDCPTSLNGSVCSSTSKACITTTTKEEMENPTTPSTDTGGGSVGQIKAISCTGNDGDQIPAGLPAFVRALYNILKLLVPIIIIVFFVMAISQWVFGLVGEKNNFMGCVSCFLTTESDCRDAGYIDPAVNDRQNKTPTKVPPKSTHTVTTNTKDDDDNKSSKKNKKGTKTILLGDSRTAGICGVGDSYYSGTCRDYQAVCQTGKGYIWFEQTGSNGVTTILKNDSNTKYNIVILLGVNDISGTSSEVKAVATKYMDIVKKLAKGDWKNQNIIFGSVTPIGGDSTGGSYPVTKTNISDFNSAMKSKISSAKLSNVSYCNINKDLSLKGKYASDLLHYTDAGYTAVYNQIKKKCL